MTARDTRAVAPGAARPSVAARLGWAALAAFVLAYPWLFPSNYAVDWGMLVLFTAFLGQSWNIAGGFAGQFSFGHAVFFGTGAYCSAILGVTYGVNPWLAWGLAALAGGAVGLAIGVLSFRFGLRGSYFALITLAFAEFMRVLADSLSFTQGGLGILVPMARSAKNLQFEHAASYYYLAALLCAVSMGIAFYLKRSRFGARLAAIRENEAAAMALGIDVFREKVRCLALSGALAGAGGAFYVQKYLYIDPHIAFNIGRSVEMLLVAMVGGAGTVFGPLLGATVLNALGEATRAATQTPGLSLIIYGVVLIAIVGFLPGGLASLAATLRGKRKPHA